MKLLRRHPPAVGKLVNLKECAESREPVATSQPEYSYYYEVKSDHVIQELWRYQDQNARNQSYQRFVWQVRKVHCASPFGSSVYPYLLSLYIEK